MASPLSAASSMCMARVLSTTFAVSATVPGFLNELLGIYVGQVMTKLLNVGSFTATVGTSLQMPALAAAPSSNIHQTSFKCEPYSPDNAAREEL